MGKIESKQSPTPRQDDSDQFPGEAPALDNALIGRSRDYDTSTNL